MARRGGARYSTSWGSSATHGRVLFLRKRLRFRQKAWATDQNKVPIFYSYETTPSWLMMRASRGARSVSPAPPPPPFLHLQAPNPPPSAAPRPRPWPLSRFTSPARSERERCTSMERKADIQQLRCRVAEPRQHSLRTRTGPDAKQAIVITIRTIPAHPVTHTVTIISITIAPRPNPCRGIMPLPPPPPPPPRPPSTPPLASRLAPCGESWRQSLGGRCMRRASSTPGGATGCMPGLDNDATRPGTSQRGAGET